VAAPPERRPGTFGIAGSSTPDRAAAHRAEAPRPGISGASEFGSSSRVELTKAPDLARFLEATKPQAGDDLDDEPDGSEDGTPSRVPGRTRRWLIRTGIIVMIAVIAAVLLRAFVVQPYYIPSESMEPTLHGCAGCNDDHVLVDKISYRAHDVRSGDIVVFHRPADAAGYISEKILIKRVIALPGDTVDLRNGLVYVNKLLIDEPYINTKKCGPRATNPLTSVSHWTVPGNDVFVMGDNRCQSEDSRQFGPIATSSIVGRAFAIIWPLNRIRLL
jgi:signal peptidase I